MGAADKALKLYAKGVVTAAKNYANVKDGHFDNYTSDYIVMMLDTYISILEESALNNVLGKVNYDKYIAQIEKIRDKFIDKYGTGEEFVQTTAEVNDAYVYPAEDVAPIDSADFPTISLVGVVAE